MKISILTPDFSHNCFGRAWLLAKLLQPNFDIEIIGPAFGNGIWKPLKDECDFQIKIVKGFPNGRFEIKKMLKIISGDVIYASKPRSASFGVGLIKKIVTRKPLLLDIDDWELGFGREFFDSLVWYKKINDILLSLKNFSSPYYSYLLSRLTFLADRITVSGSVLNRRYGGTIIWHVRDSNYFMPEKYNKTDLKRKYLSNIERDSFIIGFIGTPRAHKGIEDLIDAITILNRDDVLLMVVGNDEDDYSRSLVERVKQKKIADKVVFMGLQPFQRLPELLSLMDVIVVPQRKRKASEGQVPAKIFDAMVMAKPIIATNVSEIPEILDECGLIVSSENPEQIRKAIEHVMENYPKAKVMGEKARDRYIKEFSWQKAEYRLIKILDSLNINE
ncbi:MAG: hypothetical protein A2Y97_02335 [Nitrospirae bacterium RBG_13_39_12]|nr:MAG: hypothetical protein A2Y97_02335 [Nitrospirae bacterium RBG_13_39_12]